MNDYDLPFAKAILSLPSYSILIISGHSFVFDWSGTTYFVPSWRILSGCRLNIVSGFDFIDQLEGLYASGWAAPVLVFVCKISKLPSKETLKIKSAFVSFFRIIVHSKSGDSSSLTAQW